MRRDLLIDSAQIGERNRRATLYFDGLDAFAKPVNFFEGRGPPLNDLVFLSVLSGRRYLALAVPGEPDARRRGPRAAHRQIKTRYVGAMASDQARTRKLSSAPVISADTPCHQRTRPGLPS